MKNKTITIAFLFGISISIGACAGGSFYSSNDLRDIANAPVAIAAEEKSELANLKDAQFLKSGTIVLSRKVPDRNYAKFSSELPAGPSDSVFPRDIPMAPLLGYFPPAESYFPADNESWLEVDSKNLRLSLYEGSSKRLETPIEGDLTLSEGNYFLQHKERNPLWYAPVNYFQNRGLNIPNEDDRFLRGVYGEHALFPTTNFPIHSAAVWSEEIGGLRISRNAMDALYELVTVGIQVVVK